MIVCYITFRSVTLAQRGERILKQEKIYCRLQRTPRWMEEQGCGYCLKLSREDVGAAVDALRSGKADFRKVYQQMPGGNVEEVPL